MRDWLIWLYTGHGKSWMAHAVIAALLVLVSALLGSATFGAGMAIGFYLLREIEQVLWDGRIWLDTILDVLSPTVAALLVWWLLT